MKISLFAISLATLVVFAFVGTQSVHAATTITVQTTGDGAANAANCPGASCRLRDALAKAINGDTINFSVTGTITLNSGELGVSNNVTIAGPGANVLAVNANAASRVFHIASGKTVTISGLTITNGSAVGFNPASDGAGIFNDHANLTVNNCTISRNSADNVGGGIWNDGEHGSATLTLNNTTLSGNLAADGGGIYTDGEFGSATLTVNNSTLSGNSAPSAGGAGGIYNDGHAGGSATLTVNNSTLSSNTGGSNGAGGILNSGAGGSATLTISSTILTGTSGANIVNDSGTVTSNGYNLSSDNGGGFLTVTGDQTNTNPMLGALAYYGGPTATHILLTGSPAINAGDPSFVPPPSTDQRGVGFARVVSGRIDIGAFERQPNDIDPTLVVTTTADTNTNSTCASANPCSLRDAITAANASAPDDVIYFSVTGTITLNSLGALPNLASNLKILGPGANALTVKRAPAAAHFRIFAINTGEIVTLSGLTISGGDLGNLGVGGGIDNFHGTLTLAGCAVSGNSASFGGGIENDGSVFPPVATLTVNNSTISGNSASGGGGFHNVGAATLTINNSTISGNISASGGGVDNDDSGGNSVLIINNSTLSGNSAAGVGGGIWNHDTHASFDLTGTLLNAGAGSGANIYNQGVVTSHGYNLSSDAGVTNSGSGTGSLNGTGDQTNTNPMLDPNGLQDNGGPTLTIALLPGSPAIDKGKNFSGSMFDQRGPGFVRTFDKLIANAAGGDGTDIGAFEVQNTPPTINSVPVSRTQGQPSSNSQIATISDDADQPTALTVTVNGSNSATVNGVTVSNIAIDNAGNVTADVIASCSASNANFTLRVTDTGGLFSEATLTVNVIANQPPSITGATISRTQGQPSSNSQIAIVGDDHDQPASLAVTVNGGSSATVNGVTVSNIAIDVSGHVTADVVASCSAFTTNFTLRVTDHCGLFSQATLTVSVTGVHGCGGPSPTPTPTPTPTVPPSPTPTPTPTPTPIRRAP